MALRERAQDIKSWEWSSLGTRLSQSFSSSTKLRKMVRTQLVSLLPVLVCLLVRSGVEGKFTLETPLALTCGAAAAATIPG